MYTTTLLHEEEALVVDVHETVEQAVRHEREHWLEQPCGPLLLVVRDEAGWAVAVLSRPQADAELCVTSYADGRSEVHRCRYLLGECGGYVRTEVVEVSRAVLARAG